jgi:putative Flp pilus-assembly TadE/G-like protein
MLRRRSNLRAGDGSKDQKGVIITLVAVFMLFVVGAMAALSIDVVTIYTARSEAQLAADSAALAAARVIANSGATSDTTGTLLTSVESSSGPARAIAYQVAEQNQVGGTNLTSSQITVSFGGGTAGTTNPTNPTVNVKVQTSLPTFFARVWGSTQVTVGASATAEAYNPSATSSITAGGGTRPTVAPMCVKPWLLPNMSPGEPGATNARIFDPTTGAILDTGLLGWVTPPGGPHLRTDCTATAHADCTGTPPGWVPTAWWYYPGTTDPTTGNFPAPSASSVTCSGCTGFNNYQLSIAGCVQTPISCNATVSVDQTPDATRDSETADPVNDMTHATTNKGDSVDTSVTSPPFQFLAGDDNPVPGTKGNDVMVSDSLVTVPVINVDSVSGLPATYPTVQIIGFVQLFLNPNGTASPATGHIRTQVINLAGCGTTASGTPIIGNGASPVVVRLISGS